MQMSPPNDPVPLIAAKALWMRRRAIQMVYAAQLGHQRGDGVGREELPFPVVAQLQGHEELPEAVVKAPLQ